MGHSFRVCSVALVKGGVGNQASQAGNQAASQPCSQPWRPGAWSLHLSLPWRPGARTWAWEHCLAHTIVGALWRVGPTFCPKAEVEGPIRQSAPTIVCAKQCSQTHFHAPGRQGGLKWRDQTATLLPQFCAPNSALGTTSAAKPRLAGCKPQI